MTITDVPPLDKVDLTDLELFLNGDPHAVWKLLREESPVHWQDRSWGPGFWNITRYEDVIRISVDPQTFISSKGIILDNTGVATQRQEAMRQNGAVGVDARGNMMIMSDPPKHTMLRQLVNKGFTRKAMLRLEDHILELVTRIIDDIAERGECDFVMDVSRLLPLEVICELMGVPEGDWEAMFELSNRVIGFDDPEYNTQGAELTPEDLQLSMDLFGYMNTLIEERRKDPKDDLLTVLVNSEVEGQSLSEAEIFFFFLLLIIAGNETTRNATSGGMLALIQNPDQRQRLIDDPELVGSAVEEILRWTSPVTHFTRFATADTEVGGQKIAEGDEVCMWYPSANRDESVFTNADVFDIGREPNDHIAFGKGEHFCLGANLARIELRIMFRELMRRVPDMELAGEPERLRSNFIGGIKRMPVTFTPTG